MLLVNLLISQGTVPVPNSPHTVRVPSPGSIHSQRFMLSSVSSPRGQTNSRPLWVWPCRTSHFYDTMTACLSLWLLWSQALNRSGLPVVSLKPFYAWLNWFWWAVVLPQSPASHSLCSHQNPITESLLSLTYRPEPVYQKCASRQQGWG